MRRNDFFLKVALSFCKFSNLYSEDMCGQVFYFENVPGAAKYQPKNLLNWGLKSSAVEF